MKSRVLLIIITFIIASVLITGACSAGFIAGRMINTDSPWALIQPPALPGFSSPAAKQDAGTPENLQELFTPFWQAWDLVHNQYVDQPVDDEALMRGAIRGMLEALGDEHTSFLDAEQYEMFNAHLEGEYEGIGAWVDVRGDYLTVISPIPGSPAEEAGLRPGDQIVAVDGEDMTGIDAELVRRKVIGPEGTTVRLTIKREGLEDTFEITLTRASITVPSVEAEMLEGNIAYVRLLTFGEDSTNELRDALNDLMANNPTGLVLDLRNNGGGYKHIGVEVASQFISEGVVMYEEYGDGRRVPSEASGDGVATEIPLVVLINEGSASASEIVAGAIQDTGRGKLVGETSFGKGSVQVFSRLANDQGAVRITIARWLTPDGKSIHGVGLEPEVKVELTEEDFQAERDPQLDKAIELLTNP